MNSEQQSPADGEVLVRVEGVSKKFCRSLKKSLWYGVCDIAGELNPFARHGAGGMEHGVGGSASGGSNPLVTRHSSPVTPEARDEDLRDGEFYAVRDVSFELRRGECLGLIGHNGAGKTTLLKMLNGLIKPDAGTITMRGRVGALIALGAGFNPILTGRENIYINGSVLGLSKKEIDGKIDEIIDFAELREFIEMPVQSYSSGMAVRLGFAVATSLNPDVLILDEVLAVGDERFAMKCFERIGRLLGSGVAGILVTHQMKNVERICSRVAVMDRGAMTLDTPEVAEGISRYLNLSAPTGSGIEVIHHDSSYIQIESVDVSAGGERVILNLKKIRPGSERLLASYTVRRQGIPLIQATTRTADQPLVPVINDRIVISVPEGLRQLGPVTLDLSLWDFDARVNLVWVKGITIRDPDIEPLALGFIES